MALLSSVISWLIKKRIHQIELFKKYPVEVQEELLSKLINAGIDTEWGKKYDFAKFSTIDDFRKNVPLSKYEDLEPVITRLRKGEKNLLWPEEIKWFAKSSGTTAGKSKFIPISQSSLEDCHFKAGKDLISIYFNLYPNSKLFEGKSLIMGGSSQIQEVSNQSFYEGDLSAILMQNLPFWAEFMRTPSLNVALMDEWEKKLELMVEETIHHDVRSISGVPSWMLVLLKKILDKTGEDNIIDVWPNLEVFFHGGVSFKPYEKQYHEIICSDKMVYLETYNASEGFFGIQDDLSKEGMLLMLDYGIFYEFMPLSELGNQYPKTYTIEEVELNKDYALIISTNGGLWRYIIGDTVRFVSLYPHRIIITGRTKHFINAFGEELIIDNAIKGLKIACEKTGAVIHEFTAAPVFMSENTKGRHQWIIEFEKKPQNINEFAKILDEALKSLNSDYEAKRYKDMTLEQLEIIEARKNLFIEWLKSKNKLGGQHKVPRLANNREYIDELIELNNKK